MQKHDYLDDVIIFSESGQDHIKRLKILMALIFNQGCKSYSVSQKCHLAVAEVDLLGHRVRIARVQP